MRGPRSARADAIDMRWPAGYTGGVSWRGTQGEKLSSSAVGSAVRACTGSQVSGDAVGHWTNGEQTLLCVIDGLGHGPAAETAAQAALAYVDQRPTIPLAELFAGCDRAIASTRGVAMGLLRIDNPSGSMEYAAVGNTRIMLTTPAGRRFFVSTPGIVGAGYRRLAIERTTIAPGTMAWLYTDGLPRVIDVDALRSGGIDELDQLAQACITSFGKTSDDNAVLIYRHL